jgi:hypothetical protein
LLASRYGNIQCCGDFRKAVGMVMLHRLLEPHVAQFLQHPPNANGTLDRVPIIRIKGQWKGIAHELAHGTGLGNILGESGIACGFVGIKAAQGGVEPDDANSSRSALASSRSAVPNTTRA